jgi:hypothetical protein
MRYCIVNCDNPATYWSDVDGWVRYSYDLYDEDTRLTKRLPLSGMWQEEPTFDVRHTKTLVT